MKPSVFEPWLAHDQPTIYLPGTGTSAAGRGLGPAWATGANVTVSHPTPANSFAGQFRRTRFVSQAFNDLELGVHLPNAEDVSAWRGDAANRGGFYFSCRFIVRAIPDVDVRLFCGLSAQTGSGACQSNTLPNNTVGLWSDDTDALNLTIGTKASGAITKTALGTAESITLDRCYEFVMICNPNQAVIVTSLIDFENGTLLTTQNVSATMPASTAFMAPQVGLSNAGNNTGGDTAFEVISLYLRPNQRRIPIGSP